MGWTMAAIMGGKIHCHDAGSDCHVSVMKQAEAVRPDYKHFVTSSLPPNERNGFHDEILVKLTEDINALIEEAQKKKPDKRIGITKTPPGLFISYMENYPASEEWKRDATTINAENVVKLLGLKDPNEPE